MEPRPKKLLDQVCTDRKAKAGGRESASRFLLGPLAAEEAPLGNGCSAPELAGATVTDFSDRF